MRLQDAGLNNAAPVRPGMDAGRANRAMDGPLFALPRSQDYSERIKSCTARSWGRPAGKGISSPVRHWAWMLKNAAFLATVLIKNCGTAVRCMVVLNKKTGPDQARSALSAWYLHKLH